MADGSRASDRRRFVTRAGKELSFTALGFGSAPLGNYLRPLSEEDCDRTVSAAWDSGVRYFDTAPLYGLGLSEMRVGRLLVEAPATGFHRLDQGGSSARALREGRSERHVLREHAAGAFPLRLLLRRRACAHTRRASNASVSIGSTFCTCTTSALSRTADGPGPRRRIRELVDTGGWRALAELRDRGDVLAIGAGVNEWEPCAQASRARGSGPFPHRRSLHAPGAGAPGYTVSRVRQTRRRHRRRWPVQLRNPGGRLHLQLSRRPRPK